MPDSVEPYSYVGVGGDFARVFDHEDYIAMARAVDEASVVLRAHLILEEFINIWASRLTNTDDLFAGTFVPFKTKLCVSRNLGLSDDYFAVLDKFNEVRNRYSHRRKYAIEESTLDVLRTKIDALTCEPILRPCADFELFLGGTDTSGQLTQVTYTWATADTKRRTLIIVVVFVLKFVQWMQREFASRGIQYQLVVWPPPCITASREGQA